MKESHLKVRLLSLLNILFSRLGWLRQRSWHLWRHWRYSGSFWLLCLCLRRSRIPWNWSLLVGLNIWTVCNKNKIFLKKLAVFDWLMRTNLSNFGFSLLGKLNWNFSKFRSDSPRNLGDFQDPQEIGEFPRSPGVWGISQNIQSCHVGNFQIKKKDQLDIPIWIWEICRIPKNTLESWEFPEFFGECKDAGGLFFRL